jgi:hypothetical protein
MSGSGSRAPAGLAARPVRHARHAPLKPTRISQLAAAHRHDPCRARRGAPEDRRRGRVQQPPRVAYARYHMPLPRRAESVFCRGDRLRATPRWHTAIVMFGQQRRVCHLPTMKHMRGVSKSACRRFQLTFLHLGDRSSSTSVSDDSWGRSGMSD